MTTPTWRLTIFTADITVTSRAGVQPVVVEGSGSLPELEALGVIFPPPPFPPSPPPVVVPPPEDHTPFPFPGQPPYNPTDPSARYSNVATDPVTGQFLYAASAEYANPLPGSHWYAGMLGDLRRLWVPRAADPATIRRVLLEVGRA